MSGNRTVFIGNIPYGVSEDVITGTLERVGQVLHFRLVYDKETGKPKGFGFAEYSDADQAAAAVRNLNDYELMGRKLRVDYSNDGKDDKDPGASNNNAPAPAPAQSAPVNGQNAGPTSNELPPFPSGTDLGIHLTAQDAISATVSTIPPTQLLDAMLQMQELARADPERATQLLQQGPQLTYAILQILLLMKLIDPATLGNVIQQTAAPAPPRPAPPPVQAPPPQQTYSPYPQGQPPYGAGPTPPVAPPYQPPQPPAAAPPPADPNALYQQVLAMPQAQIDALPPNDRAQIMALRQQLMQQYTR